MTTERPKFLAYARLLRLPNAFTAMADPLAGWFAVGGGVPVRILPLVVLASACFYTAGAVLDDLASVKASWMLGVALMISGLVLAALAGPVPFGVGVFLAAMTLFYNTWARRLPTLRPLVLGACRFAGFLLGMRCLPLWLVWMPALVGLYATATAFLSMRKPTTSRLLLGIIAVEAAIVMLSPFGDWVGALLVLSLLVPAFVLDKMLAVA